MNKYLQKLSLLLTALSLGVGFAVAQGTLRNEVIKPLAAAQEAIKNNQNDQALGLLRDALAVPQLTANEKNMISRTQAVAALRAGAAGAAGAAALALALASALALAGNWHLNRLQLSK